MKIKKTKLHGKSTALADFNRIIHPREFCYRLGDTMMKKSLKVAAWTTLVTTSGFMATKLGLGGLTGAQAAIIPVSVGLSMLSGGAALKYVPNLKTARLLTFSQANDMNRMEDYKKLNAWDHLDLIWERVYKPESFMRYGSDARRLECDEIISKKNSIIKDISNWPDDRMRFLGMEKRGDSWDPVGIEDLAWALMCTRPLSKQVAKSKIGFKISAMHALCLPLTVSRKFSRQQRDESNAPAVMNDEDNTGLKLDLYKDWIDGAVFDPTDTKLLEQYLAKDSIREIKSELGMGLIRSLMDFPKKTQRRFWFYLMNRRMAYESGKAIQYLESRYHTDKFNVLILLCPGEENAQWLEKFPGAKSDVLEQRTKIIQKAFGDNYERASALIDRIFSPDFELATQLRLAYDPEYWAGDYVLHDSCNDVDTIESNTIIQDLKENGYEHGTDVTSSLSDCCLERLEHINKFVDYANDVVPGGLTDKEALRAVKTVFYTNKGSVRTQFRNKLSANSGHYDNAAIDQIITSTVRNKEAYTSRIITLREHQAIAMLVSNGYKALVKELGY